MANIRGVVTSVPWSKKETGRYLIAFGYEVGSEMVEGRGWITSSTPPEPGDCFSASGDWDSVEFRGRKEDHFKARSFRADIPGTRACLERFLVSNFAKEEYGIDTASLQRLSGTFGAGTLSVLLNKPALLCSMSTAPDEVLARWERKTRVGKASLLLNGHGWNEAEIDVVVRRYGEETYDLLQDNPYVAARVPQIGFHKADQLALSMGISPEDRRRIDEAILSAISKHAAEGSTCSTVGAICRDLPDGIFGNCPPEEKEEICADYLKSRGAMLGAFQVISMPGGEILCSTRDAARVAARATWSICEMLGSGRRHELRDVDRACEQLFAPGGKYERLDDVQRSAVRMAATEPFCLLGGGPGVGKTTVMEAVADVLELLGEKTILLAAPFGKASKRLSETTGRKATTVHRLLGAEGVVDGKAVFRHGPENPLPAGCCVVIDETSTQDEAIWVALLAALPADGRIVFVGDPEQLPSVGPGAVLRDMIQASTINGGIPMTYLTEVYRSGKDSGIALGAAEIRTGKVPEITKAGENGVSFTDCDQNAITRLVVEEVRRMKASGLDPIKDLAVLCPQAPGPAGTWELNTALARLLNPGRKPITGVMHGPFDNRKMPVPHVGDRVMLTENETKTNLMNGDIGTVVRETRMPDGKPGFTVRYDDGVVKDYASRDWRSLILAYAGTIHKYQGSQAHTVIMPVCEAHSRMLDRPILYTGWTRAQKSLKLIGSRRAFEQAVVMGEKLRRETMLERVLPHHVLSLARSLHGRLNWNRLAVEAQERVTARRRATAAAESMSATWNAPKTHNVQKTPETQKLPDTHKPQAPSPTPGEPRISGDTARPRLTIRPRPPAQPLQAGGQSGGPGPSGDTAAAPPRGPRLTLRPRPDRMETGNAPSTGRGEAGMEEDRPSSRLQLTRRAQPEEFMKPGF